MKQLLEHDYLQTHCSYCKFNETLEQNTKGSKSQNNFTQPVPIESYIISPGVETFPQLCQSGQ